MTIAEESTAWPNVTSDIGGEGLGFSFKWNMGWMHDFCEYMKLDPLYRKGNHYAMTFAMSYITTVRTTFCPCSHDEEWVHLKCSMVNKMPGILRINTQTCMWGYAFMFGHSGKSCCSWDRISDRSVSGEERELDWYLLGEKLNQGNTYIKELLNCTASILQCMRSTNTWGRFRMDERG